MNYKILLAASLACGLASAKDAPHAAAAPAAKETTATAKPAAAHEKKASPAKAADDGHEDVHWAYSGAGGPAHWAKLSPDNFQCAGKNQSPVNLAGFIEADLRPTEFSYQAGGQDVLNNGHTIQLNFAKGSSIKLDGETFNLVQMHFHAPSENQIRGKSYPLEAHLVHADPNGRLAVVAVMYAVGAENPGLAAIWSRMPGKAGEKKAVASRIDADAIIPATRDYYRFNGSLTTPPCSEGVRWIVLKATATASKAQVDAFAKTMKHANNRPLQALNARMVLE